MKLAESYVEGSPKLRLVWCCKGAVGQIQRSWRSQPLDAVGIELTYVDLDEATHELIRMAQLRQKR